MPTLFSLPVTKMLSELPGWRKGQSYIGMEEWIEGDGQDRMVRIYEDGSWELYHWTDSDVETEWGMLAVARYKLDAEGETIDELRGMVL